MSSALGHGPTAACAAKLQTGAKREAASNERREIFISAL
jgi:hypothetical protein